MDVVIVVPLPALAKHPLELGIRAELEELGIRLIEVDWIVPKISDGVPWWIQRSWCVGQDFFKLHVLGLDEYEAVVFYDNDVLVDPREDGGFEGLFECARQNYFLASGLHGGFEALCVAFFAARPSKELLRGVLRYLANFATYDQDTGWNGLGFGPWGCFGAEDSSCLRSWHVGGECGQGLLYALIFFANPGFDLALREESRGVAKPVGAMVDGCLWLHENVATVRGFPKAANPCDDVAAADRCHEAQAFHSMARGRGCGIAGLLRKEIDQLLEFRPEESGG